MRRIDVRIPAADGQGNGTSHVPEGDGPWPGVLVFPARADGGADRATGWRVWVCRADPDIYPRGRWAPFDVNTVFTDERAGGCRVWRAHQ
jgi:carboxymethylenebutenolidase